jgi:hypothetical protein
MQREYIVTLRKHEDLESFYEDMETPGGNFYIPDRPVPVHARRSISRSTNYFLTEEEASLIKNDPRVLIVELTLEELGLERIPYWTEQDGWNKRSLIESDHRNWGLLRCVEGQNISNWGSDAVAEVNGLVRATSSGKHVDVVIVDGHITQPNHPEFAKNKDGSGGSRVVQFNWFSLNSQLGLGPNGVYEYTPLPRPEDDPHGYHVAGTVAGNSQGWARDANIYNITPFRGTGTYVYFMDYIRQWHRNKPINPETGRRNPTITNHSYGRKTSFLKSQIQSIEYRGIIYQAPFSDLQLASFNISPVGSTLQFSEGVGGSESEDLKDLVNEGIIVVGAAGNDSQAIARYSEDPAADYNNRIILNTGRVVYYNRGTNTATPTTICVGSIGSNADDRKSSFSNSGPRIDIYAPGSNIASAWLGPGSSVAPDYRNNNYTISKISGTSMASPQVAGVLACLAEQWPTMTAEDAIEHLKKIGTTDQITNIPDSTYFDLNGSDNRYLRYQSQRPLDGKLYPTLNQGLRPEAGQKWPRAKIYRYGK